MRCWMLPCWICPDILYLTQPCFVFSLWLLSVWVLLLSLLAWDSSLDRIISCRCTRSLFSASAIRFSSLDSEGVLAGHLGSVASVLLPSYSRFSWMWYPIAFKWWGLGVVGVGGSHHHVQLLLGLHQVIHGFLGLYCHSTSLSCLLYTSDAADDPRVV